MIGAGHRSSDVDCRGCIKRPVLRRSLATRVSPVNAESVRVGAARCSSVL